MLDEAKKDEDDKDGLECVAVEEEEKIGTKKRDLAIAMRGSTT